MSWSKTFTGKRDEVIKGMVDTQDAIRAELPEFEKSDVQRVMAAAALLLHEFNPRAHLTVALSGHGYRNTTDGTGGGAMTVRLNYDVGDKQE